MEITIAEDKVKATFGGIPSVPAAVEARQIASFLSPLAQRAEPKIVHNVDASYIGIRLEARSGPVVIEVLPNGGIRLLQEFIEPVGGRMRKQLASYPAKRQPKAKAFMAEEFLKSRGLLG